MQVEEMRLDGNAAGGMLRDLFTLDATTADATCAGCGGVRPIGALPAYASDMGIILRCPSCDVAILRVARTPGRLRVDFSGVSFLTIPE